MKKIIIVLTMFMLVFPLVGLSVKAESSTSTTNIPNIKLTTKPTTTREKILNLTEIKNFKNIEKIGNILFGIKVKQNQEQPKKIEVKQPETTMASSSSLEKISDPAKISLFSKIQKIGTALWGIRKDEGKDNQKLVYVTPAAVQCVKTAIDKKDASIKTSTSKHSQNILTAIDTRNSCQKSALDKTTAKEQFAANKLCSDVFQKGMKDNNATMEKEKNEAHKIYRTELKSCSALQTTNSTTTEEIKIEDGENITE